MLLVFFFFFFKQKTAYEMRISDWSSDVCSSDLLDAFGDQYMVRGFGVSQTVNGVATAVLNHARDTANVERIEVLKGPASVLYGQMQPGAVINIVTRSDERRAGTECVSQCSSQWSQYHYKNKKRI